MSRIKIRPEGYPGASTDWRRSCQSCGRLLWQHALDIVYLTVLWHEDNPSATECRDAHDKVRRLFSPEAWAWFGAMALHEDRIDSQDARAPFFAESSKTDWETPL